MPAENSRMAACNPVAKAWVPRREVVLQWKGVPWPEVVQSAPMRNATVRQSQVGVAEGPSTTPCREHRTYYQAPTCPALAPSSPHNQLSRAESERG